MNTYQENTIQRVRAKLADVGPKREPTFTWKEVERLMVAIEAERLKNRRLNEEVTKLRYQAQR